MPDHEAVPTMEISTIALESEAEAAERMEDLRSLTGVQCMRIRGSAIVLTVCEDVVHDVHRLLRIAGLIHDDDAADARS